MKITVLAALLGAAVLLAATGVASGQVISDSIAPNAQAPWNTASSGTMALRAPGRLVSLGRAQFREAHARAITRSRFGPVIDEPAPEGPTLDQLVRIELIETVFDNLNAGLLVLLNAIRASGGLDPVVPGGADLSDLLGRITGPG